MNVFFMSRVRVRRSTANKRGEGPALLEPGLCLCDCSATEQIFQTAHSPLALFSPPSTLFVSLHFILPGEDCSQSQRANRAGAERESAISRLFPGELTPF